MKKENKKKELNKLFKANIVLFVCILVLLGLILLIINANQYEINKDLQEKNTELVIKEFNSWKENFDPRSQVTYFNCVRTNETFKKLYCNIRYTEYYNQSYIFN